MMPDVSIALIRESNRLLSAAAKKPVVPRSSILSQEAINTLMRRAFISLTR
jgi:hypothetical protein